MASVLVARRQRSSSRWIDGNGRDGSAGDGIVVVVVVVVVVVARVGASARTRPGKRDDDSSV